MWSANGNNGGGFVVLSVLPDVPSGRNKVFSPMLAYLLVSFACGAFGGFRKHNEKYSLPDEQFQTPA